MTEIEGAKDLREPGEFGFAIEEVIESRRSKLVPYGLLSSSFHIMHSRELCQELPLIQTRMRNLSLFKQSPLGNRELGMVARGVVNRLEIYFGKAKQVNSASRVPAHLDHPAIVIDVHGPVGGFTYHSREPLLEPHPSASSIQYRRRLYSNSPSTQSPFYIFW
jgi:hypothetical protein